MSQDEGFLHWTLGLSGQDGGSMVMGNNTVEREGDFDSLRCPVLYSHVDSPSCSWKQGNWTTAHGRRAVKEPQFHVHLQAVWG